MNIREEALNIFNSLDDKGLREFVETFEWAVHEPNEESRLAMEETEEITNNPNAIGYTNINDLRLALES